MIKLLLVDNCMVVRQRLKSLLESKSNFKVVGEANNGKEAVSQVKMLHPDIVLMDVEMPVMNGLKATRIINQQSPHTKIIIMTTFDNAEYVRQSIKFGARGYLLKTASLEELALAIELVFKDCIYMKHEIFDRIRDNFGENNDESLVLAVQQLTTREKEVLNLLATGAKNKEIARSLCLSESTVKNYVSRILGRLQLRDRVQAALFANSYLEHL